MTTLPPSAAPAVDRFLVVDGRRLEVRTIAATRDAQPTLVFLHEGIGSVSLWRDFPERLAARTGCAAVVYSRFGYGRSAVFDAPRTADYMHHEALVVLPELLAMLGIARPVLIGHSDGASIALIHAGRHPDTHAVVVEAPHAFVEDKGIAGIRATRRAWETTDLPAKLARHHDDPARTFFAWNDVWLDPAFAVWNIEAFLPEIRCPVLAIQGHDDEYGTMAQVEAVARGMRAPCELVKLDRCGHTPHRDRADDVLDVMARFVAAHPPTMRDPR